MRARGAGMKAAFPLSGPAAQCDAQFDSVNAGHLCVPIASLKGPETPKKSSAWGPFWPPVPRPRLMTSRPPGGMGFPLRGRVMAEEDRIGIFGGEEEGGGVRSGPGEARTILLATSSYH